MNSSSAIIFFCSLLLPQSVHSQASPDSQQIPLTGNSQIDVLCKQAVSLNGTVTATRKKQEVANETLLEMLSDPVLFSQTELLKDASVLNAPADQRLEYRPHLENEHLADRLNDIKSGIADLPAQLGDILGQGQKLIAAAAQLPAAVRSMPFDKAPAAAKALSAATKYVKQSVNDARLIAANLKKTLSILTDLLTGKPVRIAVNDLENTPEAVESLTREELLHNMNSQYEEGKYGAALESAFQAYKLDPADYVTSKTLKTIAREHYSDVSAVAMMRIYKAFPSEFLEFKFFEIPMDYQRKDSTKVARILTDIGRDEKQIQVLQFLTINLDPEVDTRLYDRIVDKCSSTICDRVGNVIIPRQGKVLMPSQLLVGALSSIAHDSKGSFDYFVDRLKETDYCAAEGVIPAGNLFKRCLVEPTGKYISGFVSRGFVRYLPKSVLSDALSRHTDRLYSDEAFIDNLDLGSEEPLKNDYTKAKMLLLAGKSTKYMYYFKKVIELMVPFDPKMSNEIYYGISCLMLGQNRRAEILLDGVFAYGNDNSRKFLGEELKWYSDHGYSRFGFTPMLARYGLSQR